MDELRKPYTVTENGVDHVYLLTDEDAKARGLKQETPKNKQEPKPRNK